MAQMNPLKTSAAPGSRIWNAVEADRENMKFAPESREERKEWLRRRIEQDASAAKQNGAAVKMESREERDAWLRRRLEQDAIAAAQNGAAVKMESREEREEWLRRRLEQDASAAKQNGATISNMLKVAASKRRNKDSGPAPAC